MNKKVDLLIKNALVFNSFFKKFIGADVYILADKFYYIDIKKSRELESKQTIDADGSYMIPGFIDIHMHIESSMLTPEPFSNHLAKYGVTTIVSEPHEIANVFGYKGIEAMIEAGKSSLIDIYYGIPSSVPSTNENLETTGASINFQDMKKLYELKDVVCVGEVMNYREIIEDNNLEISKFINFLNKEDPSYPIEGHCPSLVDLDLAKFLYLGINGDHTEHTLEEIRQRFMNGMFVEIQEKMIRPEIIDFINKNRLYEHMAFVTDDVMVDDLYENGQLNKVIKKAIDYDFPLEEAIYCASYTPSQRMNLRDRGVIAPGKLADFSLMKDLKNLETNQVFKAGKMIYSQENGLLESSNKYKFPNSFKNSIKLEALNLDKFKLKVNPSVKEVSLRVMNIKNGSTHIKESEVRLKVIDGYIDWESSGYLLALVIERHGKNGSIGYGLVAGDTIKEGAFATSWLHDHHNLLVVGSDAPSMLKVANTVVENQGGLAVAKDEEILANLKLPIAGIMSEEPIEKVARDLAKVRASLVDLGYQHYNPIMSIGTYGLAVSPYLKLTDKGLVDVVQGKILSLIKKSN